MGRAVATVLVMLVTIVVFGAAFFAVDAAAGLRLSVPASPAGKATHGAGSARAPLTATPGSQHLLMISRTPVLSGTVLGGDAITPTATLTSTPSGGATTDTQTPPVASTSPFPTPPDGVTPPRYGTLPNYPNNTPFTSMFLQSIDTSIITLTNEQRAAHGLGALVEDKSLDVIAASRSEDMVKRDYFDHFDPTGPVDTLGHRIAAVQELLARNGITFSEIGENLVRNTGLPLNNDTPAQVVQAWMNHREHRANILNPGFTRIGVGVAAENQPAGVRVVITQLFMRQSR